MKKFLSVVLSSIITAAVALSFLPKNIVNAAEEVESNKWTIFCYFCGSNLEEDESATNDIYEMIESTSGTDLRFVVMAGGSNVDHEFFKNWGTYRLLIEDGKVYKVGRADLLNMGDTRTLNDFLSWGLYSYPSEHCGVVIWDHGGGALGGCCYDDLFEGDNLTLPEMDLAFQKVAGIREEKFDFIAYDCCEMASLELACLLQDDAEYLVASQDVMPAEGFDYTSVAQYIVDNPDCEAYDACEAICNGYWESFGSDIPYYATISIMDLSKLDTLMASLGRYCTEVDSYMVGNEPASLRNALNDETDIDYNFVDLNSFITCCSVYVDPSAYALNEAAAEFVPYVRHGSSHVTVSGVTLYIPVTYLYDDEAVLFDQILPDNPGYVDFIYDLTGY